MLLCVLLLQLASFLQRNIGVLDGAKIRATVCLDDNQIAWLHLQARIFLDVEDVCTVALETHNVKQLVLVKVCQRGWVTSVSMRRRRWWRHGICRVKRAWHTARFVDHAQALLVGKV